MIFGAAIVREDLSILPELVAGAHLFVLGDVYASCRGRKQGLCLRDTLGIIRSGPRFESAFLFRKPLGNAVDQVIETKTGSLNLDVCRVPGVAQVPWGKIRSYRVFHDPTRDEPAMGDAPPPNLLGRWPPNLVFIHDGSCVKKNASWSCSSLCGAPRVELLESFPQFSDEEALISWMKCLITPPGQNCFVSVVV